MTDTSDRARAAQEGRGREAIVPHGIPLQGWKDVGWRILINLGRNRIMLMAAGVTYYMLLALVPALTCFVAIYGMFNNPETATDQLDLLRGIVPSGGLEIIRTQLMRLVSEDDQALSVTLIVSLAIAVWSAGAGFRALFEAMNVAYHEEEKRNFFFVNFLALLFTIGGTLAAVVAILAVLVIPVVLGFLPIAGNLGWLVRLAGYIAMLAVLFVGIAALYRWGPSREEPKWRWIGPGNIFAVIGTILTSVLFSWYASNFGNYNATYGSLGALIGLLTWIWLSMTIVILGANLNAEVEHQTARDTTTGEEKELGKRGAFVADTVGEVWPFDKKKHRGEN